MDIRNYLDKGDKGYISLCDLGRIFSDICFWIIILLISCIPGFCIIPMDKIYSIYLFIYIIFGWIMMLLELVVILGMFCIYEYIRDKYYNKFKRKQNYVKLIKLK